MIWYSFTLFCQSKTGNQPITRKPIDVDTTDFGCPQKSQINISTRLNLAVFEPWFLFDTSPNHWLALIRLLWYSWYFIKFHLLLGDRFSFLGKYFTHYLQQEIHMSNQLWLKRDSSWQIPCHALPWPLVIVSWQKITLYFPCDGFPLCLNLY